ncbi:unnamed protein product [marine sediment metagenome]|uniref:Uncharacterized protein n=1 Tax=marine sediment metagenome TaxID=412755 RepID=X0UT42_9ZZZZ
MLSKLNKDNQGPICKVENCEGCDKDCKTVYQQACIDYELEGQLTEQEKKHLKIIMQS